MNILYMETLSAYLILSINNMDTTNKIIIIVLAKHN